MSRLIADKFIEWRVCQILRVSVLRRVTTILGNGAEFLPNELLKVKRHLLKNNQPSKIVETYSAGVELS